jgi:hypothetical protein
MIHITAQMRVLVAIEAVDGRKGIDSLVQVCREKLSEDPFSGCVLFSEAAEEPRYACSATMAKDTGWRKSVSRKADSGGGRNRTYQARLWRLTKRNC